MEGGGDWNSKTIAEAYLYRGSAAAVTQPYRDHWKEAPALQSLGPRAPDTVC